MEFRAHWAAFRHRGRSGSEASGHVPKHTLHDIADPVEDLAHRGSPTQLDEHLKNGPVVGLLRRPQATPQPAQVAELGLLLSRLLHLGLSAGERSPLPPQSGRAIPEHDKKAGPFQDGTGRRRSRGTRRPAPRRG